MLSTPSRWSPNPPGITFKDTDGNVVNAHGGGIIKVCDTFYLHGEYFLSTTTDNAFNGRACLECAPHRDVLCP